MPTTSRAGTVRARLQSPSVTSWPLLRWNCLPIVVANGAKLNHTTKVRKNANQVRWSTRVDGPARNDGSEQAAGRRSGGGPIGWWWWSWRASSRWRFSPVVCRALRPPNGRPHGPDRRRVRGVVHEPVSHRLSWRRGGSRGASRSRSTSPAGPEPAAQAADRDLDRVLVAVVVPDPLQQRLLGDHRALPLGQHLQHGALPLGQRDRRAVPTVTRLPCTRTGVVVEVQVERPLVERGREALAPSRRAAAGWARAAAAARARAAFALVTGPTQTTATRPGPHASSTSSVRPSRSAMAAKLATAWADVNVTASTRPVGHRVHDPLGRGRGRRAAPTGRRARPPPRSRATASWSASPLEASPSSCTATRTGRPSAWRAAGRRRCRRSRRRWGSGAGCPAPSPAETIAPTALVPRATSSAPPNTVEQRLLEAEPGRGGEPARAPRAPSRG